MDANEENENSVQKMIYLWEILSICREVSDSCIQSEHHIIENDDKTVDHSRAKSATDGHRWPAIAHKKPLIKRNVFLFIREMYFHFTAKH